MKRMTLVAITVIAPLISVLVLDSHIASVGAAAAKEKYLYVWAGPQSRQSPDFIAVVDFDPKSPNYGKVLNTAPLPAAGGSGNEPHHLGISTDGKTLAAGGLLSVLKGQAEVFFFDLSDPKSPRYVSAADPPQSAITDDFVALPEGGFLVTMMGSAEGHSPGRIAEFDKQMKLIAEHPAEPPSDGFNPHGISVRPEANLMVTSDFVMPSSTLHAVPGDMKFRGSVRVWDYKARKITGKIELPSENGSIDVKLIPRDRGKRAYTAGMLDDKLYVVNTADGSVKTVFDFATVAKAGWPQLMQMTDDGKRLFITLHLAGKVAMFDTTDPEHPQLLDVADLGANSGPHFLRLTGDESRLVVSDYFLHEDDFGKVHAEGDHKIHVLRVSKNKLTLDPTFKLDFNTAISTGPARPHGLAIK